MKKLIVAFALLNIVILGLVACGQYMDDIATLEYAGSSFYYYFGGK